MKTRMGFYENGPVGIADLEGPHHSEEIGVWEFPDDGPPKHYAWDDVQTAMEHIRYHVEDIENFANVYEAVWHYMGQPERFEIFTGEDAYMESLIWAKREGVFDKMLAAGMTPEQIEEQINMPLADIPNNPE